MNTQQHTSASMLATTTGSYSFDHRSVVEGSTNVTKMSQEYRIVNGEKLKESAILEDEFSIYPGRVSPVQLKLTKSAVIYDKQLTNDSTTTLDLWDVVGVTCGRPKGRSGAITETTTASKSKSDVGAYICFYTYPYNKSASEGGIRQRREVIFRYSKEESYELNLAVIQHWRLAVDLLLNGIDIQKSEPSDIHASRLPPKRKLLVFVNPFSGRGKGKQVYLKQVAPILEEAGIYVKVIVTEKQNHAREIVRTMQMKDLKDWDGIVIVSGDGLVYEVMNGLMDRPDKLSALQTPIGVVPAGSGNAMSSAILGRLGENYMKNAIQHASFILTKRGSHPLDLVAVETPSTKRTVSFLSVAWGIIADIDIESERYRFLGAARFTMGALVRIVSLRHYRGKLHYLPVEDESREYSHSMSSRASRTPSKSIPEIGIHNDDGIQREHMTRHHSTYQMQGDEELVDLETSHSMPRYRSQTTQDFTTVGDIAFNDKFDRADDLDMNGRTSDNRRSSSEEGDDSGNLSLPNGDSHDQTLSDGSGSPSPFSMDSGSMDGNAISLLPPLSDPVPSSWTSVEDDYVGIVVTYMSHLSQDVIVWPGREFDEGCISIQLLRYPSPRKTLLSLMDAFQDGTHIEKKIVEDLYVRAFRLEPIEPESGIMTVDGESVEYGPIQGELMDYKACILTPPKR